MSNLRVKDLIAMAPIDDILWGVTRPWAATLPARAPQIRLEVNEADGNDVVQQFADIVLALKAGDATSNTRVHPGCAELLHCIKLVAFVQFTGRMNLLQCSKAASDPPQNPWSPPC
jgi:hypothetical protein